jgi:hypothetical protein
MNVRTITSFILAVALMASAAGVCAAEQSGQGRPYTGPDTPVMTTALSTEVTGFGRHSEGVNYDSHQSAIDSARL